MCIVNPPAGFRGREASTCRKTTTTANGDTSCFSRKIIRGYVVYISFVYIHSKHKTPPTRACMAYLR